ncbi:MAG: hypothetical protein Q9174_002373, partial [Haloplaca sp. 1 TL-2023]
PFCYVDGGGCWSPFVKDIFAGELRLVVLIKHHYKFEDWDILAGALGIIRDFYPKLRSQGLKAPWRPSIEDLKERYSTLQNGSRKRKDCEPSDLDILQYWGRKFKWSKDKEYRKAVSKERRDALVCFKQAAASLLAPDWFQVLVIFHRLKHVSINYQCPLPSTGMQGTAGSTPINQPARAIPTMLGRPQHYQFTDSQIDMVFALWHTGYRGCRVNIDQVIDSMNAFSTLGYQTSDTMIDHTAIDPGQVQLTAQDIIRLHQETPSDHPQRKFWTRGLPWWIHPPGERYARILDAYDFGLWCAEEGIIPRGMELDWITFLSFGSSSIRATGVRKPTKSSQTLPPSILLLRSSTMSQSEAASSRPAEKIPGDLQDLEGRLTSECAIIDDTGSKEAVEPEKNSDTTSAKDPEKLVVTLRVPREALSMDTALTDGEKMVANKLFHDKEWDEKSKPRWRDVSFKIKDRAAAGQEGSQIVKGNPKKSDDGIVDSEPFETQTSSIDEQKKKRWLHIGLLEMIRYTLSSEEGGGEAVNCSSEDFAVYLAMHQVRTILENIYRGESLEDGPWKMATYLDASEDKSGSGTGLVPDVFISPLQWFKLEIRNTFESAAVEYETERSAPSLRGILKGQQLTRLSPEQMKSFQRSSIKALEDEALEKVKDHTMETAQVNEVFQTFRSTLDTYYTKKKSGKIPPSS